MVRQVQHRELPPARSRVTPHDHAVCVYDTETHAYRELNGFLREGLTAREVTTFVHAHPSSADATRAMDRHIKDARLLRHAHDLLVAHHRDAFEIAGRIDASHAVGVVGALIRDARARGRAGTRIFVDASKEYLAAGRKEEWFAFESSLGPRLHAETSLVCAYEAKHLRDADVLARVLATHAYRFASAGIRSV